MSFIDEEYIPESGAVFNFGEIGNEELTPKIWIKNDPIKEIGCGDEFVVLITSSGRAFSYGKNDWGQLGLGNIKATNNPCCIKSLKTLNEKSVHVGCGRCHTLITTENHKLFAFGSNTDGQLGLDPSIASVAEPTEIISWNGGPIKQLSAGGEYSAALTESGDLYVWGSNSEGQLGFNDMDDEQVWQPTKLKFFPSPVTSLCCGAYHMGAISKNILYMWGEATDGKLGLGDNIKMNQSFPQKVHFDTSVKQIVCGNTHSLCLTSSGDLYAWGLGESGQLGLGPSDVFFTKPTLLKIPAKILTSFGENTKSMGKFINISAGERHTAVINGNGMIFTFGDGRRGKLGNFGGSNNYSNQMWPTLIEQLSIDLWAEEVHCGGCHTVVLARQRKVDEQLNEGNSVCLSSTIYTNNQSSINGNDVGKSRRHRRQNNGTETKYDESNLPTLKSSTMFNMKEFPKETQNNTANIEEAISNVKSTQLKSALPEAMDSEMMSLTTEDVENIQAEMAKNLITKEPQNSVINRSGSFEEKVDKFSDLMDTTYGEDLKQESTDEVVRSRPKKKRKIKAVESRQNPNKNFDQGSLNQETTSNNKLMKEKEEISNEGDKQGNIIARSEDTEVAKIGCQPGCKGKQESGTCSLI